MKDLDKERIERIYSMLINLSDGKLFGQIDRSEEDDYLESVIILLNTMAQEYSQSLTYYSYIHAPDTLLLAVHMMISLDKNHNVTYANKAAVAFMEAPTEELMHKPFTDYLESGSITTWTAIAETLSRDLDFETRVKLKFKTPAGLVTEFFCYILSLVDKPSNEQRIWISNFEPKLDSQIFDAEHTKKLLSIGATRNKKQRVHVLTSEEDIARIHEIQNYLDANLKTSLPDLKTLANTFYINEHKLKYGFKQLFGTTVYRYVTNERLKRAHLLILNTTLPFTKIITLCGFKNLSHFSKAFKAKYGCSARELREMVG